MVKMLKLLTSGTKRNALWWQILYKGLDARRASWGGSSGLKETPEGKIIFTGEDRKSLQDASGGK